MAEEQKGEAADEPLDAPPRAFKARPTPEEIVAAHHFRHAVESARQRNLKAQQGAHAAHLTAKEPKRVKPGCS